MDRFYIFGIGMLVVGSLCIHISGAATTSNPAVTEAPSTSGTTATVEATTVANNVTDCPRFQVRYEDDAMIISYEPEVCEMVVTIQTVKLRPAIPIQIFKRKNRTIRRPIVSFRNIQGEITPPEEVVGCDALPNRSLGPFVFVDTIPNECQMLLKVTRKGNPDFQGLRPRQMIAARLRGEKPKKAPKAPRFNFIPTYEYLDEFLY